MSFRLTAAFAESIPKVLSSAEFGTMPRMLSRVSERRAAATAGVRW